MLLLEKFEKKNTSAPIDPILDIEDLHRISVQKNICAYYSSKDTIKNADIVFMPYIYLFDPRFRNNIQINLKNAIIILDEGHNVEKLCEESASTSIDCNQIRVAITDINYVNINNYNLFVPFSQFKK